jgi:hypothetical protein
MVDIFPITTTPLDKPSGGSPLLVVTVGGAPCGNCHFGAVVFKCWLVMVAFVLVPVARDSSILSHPCSVEGLFPSS